MSKGRSDAFVGNWRVREYVYAPNGALVGTVRQLRRLERSGTRIRVVQECVPDAALSGHPMERFGGRHQFELSVDGPRRLYHGPAVVGHAWTVADGAMLGRGIWPEFGYAFSSFSVVCAPGVQLTGGTFGRADEPMARIVGIAIDERDGGDNFPTLEDPRATEDVATTWTGTCASIDDSGISVEVPLSRRCFRDGWEEHGPGAPARIALVPDRLQLRVEGHFQERRLVGFAHRFGPALQLEAVLAPGIVVEGLDVLDAARSRLVALRRFTVGPRIVTAEVHRLSPHSKESR
jgi:hypothetical protein